MVEPLPWSGPVDYVLHFASSASPKDYARYPIETLKLGAIGTLHSLELAKERSATFMLASTSEVYGDPLVSPQSEDYWGNVNPVGPRSVYDEAKRYAEALTTAFHQAEGVDARIVRIFNTYGPRMRPDDGRAVPMFVTQALRGEPLTVFGDGSQTRSFCFVSDEVEGIHALLKSDVTGPVNVGNPTELSILELAQKIIEITGSESRIVFRDLPTDDPKVRLPDIERAQQRLGWKPRVGLEDGLGRTIAWFRDPVSLD